MCGLCGSIRGGFTKAMLAAAVCLGAIGLPRSSAAATVIMQDSFFAGNAGSWRRVYLPFAPDTVNLPGGTWVKTAGQWGNIDKHSSDWGANANTANVSGDQLIGMAISMGSYNTGELEISARLMSGGSTNPAENRIALGFYGSILPPTNASAPLAHFSGIAVKNDGLHLFADGTEVQSVALANTGNTFHTLTYSLDVATGALGTVTFDGSTVNGLTGNVFSSARTVNAAIVVAGGQNGRGNADDFYVSAVPEPAVFGLLGLCASITLIRRRKV